VGDIKEEVQYKNLTIRFTRTNLTFNEYSVFIDAVCAGWIRDGITWLRNRFGEKYRGHMGLLGNALILCAVKTLCIDTVPEPSLIEAKKRLQADVAVLGAEELLFVEVKLHHERYLEVPVVETQLERQVAEMLPVPQKIFNKICRPSFIYSGYAFPTSQNAALRKGPLPSSTTQGSDRCA
jgi:hypothetical protein